MKEKKTGRVVKTNDTKKKEKTKLIMGIAMMVLAVAVAGGTYAYYQSNITGTVSGTILAWDCINNTGSVSLGNLKPGSSGTLTFSGKSTNFITQMKLELSWAATTYISPNLGIYKTKSGSTYSNKVNVGTTYTEVFANETVAKNTAKSFVVYYNWPIGTTAETALVTGTSNQTVTLNYRITCKEANTAQG